MRKYSVQSESKLERAVCNCCGRELLVENGILKDGFCEVEIEWGYFSNKDGMRHSFDLCEACYDKIIKQFQIPVVETEEKEYL